MNQNERFPELIKQIKEIEEEIDEIIDERDALVEEAMHKTYDQTNPISWMQTKANYEEIIKLQERKRMLERRWRDVSLAIVKGYNKDKKDNLSYRLKSGAVVRLKGLPRLSGKIIKAVGRRTARIGKSGIDKLKRKFTGFNLDEVIAESERIREKFNQNSQAINDNLVKTTELLIETENKLPLTESGLVDYSKVSEELLREYCDRTAKRDKALAQTMSSCLEHAAFIYRKMISEALKEYQIDSAKKDEIVFDFKDNEGVYLATRPEDLELLFENKLRPMYENKAMHSQTAEATKSSSSKSSSATEKAIETIKPKRLADLSPELQKIFKDRFAAMEIAKNKEPVALTDSQQAYAKYLETGDELHPAMSHDEAVKYVQENPEKVEELMKKHQSQKSLSEKKQLLLSKYSDLINQRVLELEARGKHFGSLKPDLAAEYTDNYLTNLVRVGEEKYGENFIEDIMNEPTEEPIKWLMDEVSKEEDMTVEPIIPDYSFMEPQPVEPIVEMKNEETIATKIEQLDENSLENYLSNFGMTSEEYSKFNSLVSEYKKAHPSDSDFIAEKAAISTIAQDREKAGNLTNAQSLHNEQSTIQEPVFEPNVVTPIEENVSVEANIEPEDIEPLDVKVPSPEEIAQNLTPDMVEHYRSITEGFAPDTHEYQNAIAILNAYDNLQMQADKQAAIDQLHTGDKVR